MQIEWIDKEAKVLPDQGLIKKGDIFTVNKELGDQLISQHLGKEIKEKKDKPESKSKNKGGKE